MTKQVRRAIPDEGKFIVPEEDWEFDYWTKKLGVSRTELAVAVEAVGRSAEKVTTYLDEDAVARLARAQRAP